MTGSATRSRASVAQVLDEIDSSVYEDISGLHGLTIYHTAAWHRFLARACGWRVRAYVVRDANGEIEWFLPFVRKRRLSRKFIDVCLPLSDRIGPAYRKPCDPTGAFESVKSPIEIHEDVEAPGWTRVCQKYATVLRLDSYSDVDEMRRSFHASSIRRKITKAEKRGLEVISGSSPEHYEQFEELQNVTRRRQGSPTYPAQFFRRMWEELRGNDALRLHLVCVDGRPVAGVLFLFHDTVGTYGYGASVTDRNIWQLGANQLAMWAGIRHAFERGCTEIDFGTTPIGSPDLRRYKEKWGASSEELRYSYRGANGGNSTINRSGLPARMASKALQWLPQAVFNRVSPRLLLRVT